MKQLHKQCNLESGSEQLTAWLPVVPKLKVGAKLTLKDSDEPDKWWVVKSIGDTALPKEDIKGSHNSGAWYGNDLPRGRLKGLKING